MKPLHQIIVEPLFTEKSSAQMLDSVTGCYKYTFKVDRNANKIEIKKAIEAKFEVKVSDVNTVVVRGKKRRVRIQAGYKPNWKKAFVKLVSGYKIKEFEGA
jgi:large subunit ribosomal protein L23